MGTDGDPPPTLLTLEQELISTIAASQTTDGEDYIDARARGLAKVDTIITKTQTPRRLFPSTSVPGTFMALSPPQDGHQSPTL
jgi:hypothetical protein